MTLVANLPDAQTVNQGSIVPVDDGYVFTAVNYAALAVCDGMEWVMIPRTTPAGAAFLSLTTPALMLGFLGGVAIQRAKLTTATDGTVTWTYPIPYGVGVVPNIQAIVQAGAGTTDVNNVQIDGVPTSTQCKFRVTRTQLSTVALLGLTILSIPASVGAQVIHVEAKLP